MKEFEEIITGTVAKAADRYAIDVMGIPSLVLMEKASFYVADYIAKNHSGASVLIVCGSGNNGADGICIGRMIKERGFDPLVVCGGKPWRGTREFYSQFSGYRRIGGKILPASEAEGDLPETDILVDALFGIGLKRDVTGSYRELIEKMRRHSGVKLCVDIPSGINADTGDEMGISVNGDATFTFGRNKTGLTAGAGKTAAGKVHVCDIGIPEEAYIQAVTE